ncbi:MAG TPA: Uma2 family endonuclease [Anaerolineae bacterium]|nr:Uma2 family endonuclease [Anaerolineae bacterium]
MEVATVQQREVPVIWRPMTEDEFVAWCNEDVRAEYVDGEVIVHSPVSTRHSDLAGFLGSLLRLFVERHQIGKVLGPEIQVRLRPGVRRVPDLLFLSAERLEQVAPNHIEGAPDLMVEIVSPESVSRDWRDKFLEYQAAGVAEYWVIDPDHRRAEFYALDDQGAYRLLPIEEGIVRSQAVAGFWLRPEWLWEEPLPSVLDVARQLGVIGSEAAAKQK